MHATYRLPSFRATSAANLYGSAGQVRFCLFHSAPFHSRFYPRIGCEPSYSFRPRAYQVRSLLSLSGIIRSKCLVSDANGWSVQHSTTIGLRQSRVHNDLSNPQQLTTTRKYASAAIMYPAYHSPLRQSPVKGGPQNIAARRTAFPKSPRIVAKRGCRHPFKAPSPLSSHCLIEHS
jgi:hypothetical protein